MTERINEPPWGRCLQGAVDARWAVDVAVECYCFLRNIIVDPPNHDPLTFTSQKWCFSFFRAFRLDETLRPQIVPIVVVAGGHQSPVLLEEFNAPNESSVAAMGASLVTKQAGRVPQHD